MIFVLINALRLVRELAALYAGGRHARRAEALRQVIVALAVTGGWAWPTAWCSR